LIGPEGCMFSLLNTRQGVIILAPYAHYAGHHWPYAAKLAKSLAAAGRNVQILTAFPDHRAAREVPTIRVRPCCSLPQSFSRRPTGRVLNNIYTASCLLRALPDALRGFHVHCIDANHLQLLLLILLFPIRVSSMMSGGYPFPVPGSQNGLCRSLKSKVISWLYRKAASTRRFIVQCETEGKVTDWARIVPHNLIRLIPVAIEIPADEIRKTDARNALRLPQGRTVLLLFGTHRADKDYRTVVRAAMSLGHDYHLVFAGPLISQNDPQRIVRELGYTDATVINQTFTEDEIAPYFWACDGVVLPYPPSFAKASAVLLQAAAFLRPVIASDAILFKDFLPEHGLGWIYPAGDATALADCMIALRETVSEEASSTALVQRIAVCRERFSWCTMVKIYEDMFELPSRSARNLSE
jgi:glycosyltransferase involved in cell wall biosynthesis